MFYNIKTSLICGLRVKSCFEDSENSENRPYDLDLSARTGVWQLRALTCPRNPFYNSQ